MTDEDADRLSYGQAVRYPTADPAETPPEERRYTEHSARGEGKEPEQRRRPRYGRSFGDDERENCDDAAEESGAEPGSPRIDRSRNGEPSGNRRSDDHHSAADGRLGVRQPIEYSCGGQRSYHAENCDLPYPGDTIRVEGR